MIILLLTSATVAYVIWYYVIYVPRYPKGPFPLPLVGNMFQVRAYDIHVYMQEQSAKYGPVFTLFTPRPLVCLNTFETIKEALVTKGEHFVGKLQTPPQQFFSDGKPNKGLLNGYGQNWREQRRVSLTILRNFGMGKGLMEQKVMGSVGDMLDHLEGMEDKTAVDMFEPLMVGTG
ncbi:Protein CYP-14A2 [Aphelenchoides avenae]|nr:Protein CYP-14A2 [Aphelenchus avenae]